MNIRGKCGKANNYSKVRGKTFFVQLINDNYEFSKIGTFQSVLSSLIKNLYFSFEIAHILCQRPTKVINSQHFAKN